MTSSSLYDLLPIDASVAKPNAYQVFGLSGSESDREMAAAVESVCKQLKARQFECDPKLWQQAAQLVKSSRQVLANPQKRAELDRELQASLSPSDPEPVVSEAPLDPLAGLLPSGNPLQPTSADEEALQQETAQASTAASVLGLSSEVAKDAAPPLGTPPPRSGSSEATSNEPPTPSSTEVRVSVENKVQWSPPAKRRRRRKKSPVGMILFSIVVLALLGSIVFLVDRLSKGERLAVTEPTRASEARSVTAPPRLSKPIARTVGDGIMPASATGGISPTFSDRSKSSTSLIPPGGFGFDAPRGNDAGNMMSGRDNPPPKSDAAMNVAANEMQPAATTPKDADPMSTGTTPPATEDMQPDQASIEAADKQISETE
ncbi:MAG: hypothetical protein AAGJ83_10930, partial [Planctomycetota bacterium]